MDVATGTRSGDEIQDLWQVAEWDIPWITWLGYECELENNH